MASQQQVFATASMPERIHVTQELERRFKEQEDAKEAAKSHSAMTVETPTAKR